MDASIQLNLPLTFQQLVAALRQLSLPDKQRLLSFLLKDAVQKQDEDNAILTHFASETSLAKDWLTKEENEAWQNL